MLQTSIQSQIVLAPCVGEQYIQQQCSRKPLLLLVLHVGVQGDPVASSPGYCPSRGSVLVAVSLCNQRCMLEMKSLCLVPGKEQLWVVEIMPRGFAEPVLVLHIGLVFVQKKSYSPGVALLILICLLHSAVPWKHNILIYFTESF